MKPHTHSETTTTFKADVKVRKYSCGFFCQRKTDSDVYDPKSGKGASLTPTVEKK